MSLLARVSERWSSLWFSAASPYPIAAFRILVGLYLVIYFGTMAPHVSALFSNEGVYAPYLAPDYAPSPLLAQLLFGALWLAALALMLGLHSSITIPCLLALYGYHYFLALGVKHSSFERLAVVYLLALWPSACDSVWALSAAREQSAPRPATVFAARLVRFQTIVLYLGAGLWKTANPAWRSGALLSATLQGIWATPLGFWIAQRMPSAQAWLLLSRTVIAGELLLAVLLFFVRTRPLGIVLGVIFHTSNSVILAIPEFLVCLAPYVFFVSDETFQRFSARIARLRTPADRAHRATQDT